MSIIVTGSIAYDHILHFPGVFEDHILPQNLSNLNVSFLVDNMQKMRGGCASNIAYSLCLFGHKPRIMGTVGEDFTDFEAWLISKGADTSLIKVMPGEYTASCFITTDNKNNQLTGFYTGAMSGARTLSFRDLSPCEIDIAIISPNDPQAMVKYCKECRELKIPFIFDPGQNIPRLSPQELIECMTGAYYTTVNTCELNMIMSKTEKNEKELLNLTQSLIITDGENGSEIKTNSSALRVKAAQPYKIGDPTGAGDAYRAGLITGIMAGLSPEESAKIASTTAVYVVEKLSPAQHNFTLAEFAQRYEENYQEKFPLSDKKQSV